MKWMKKLRLINWHYFKDETLEFGRQTMISGRNASGKSTIIDALQVLFVADQRLIRFNSSAHNEAKRTLINYLRGKIGSDERGYTREGDFTSYILAEFYDDKKREPFVVGVVIDVARDNTVDDEYFIISNIKLREMNLLKQNNYLLSREEFHRYYTGLSKTYSSERNKSGYQKALLSRMGQLQDRFFNIFRKALSFKPIHDIRDFVYDYILEPQELQLSLMRQNFEVYEQYQKELNLLDERRVKLQEIEDEYQQYVKVQDVITVQEYVIFKLRYDLEVENKQRLESQITELQNKIELLGKESELISGQYDNANTKAKQAFSNWQNHELKREKERLEKELKDVSSQIDRDQWLLKTLKNTIKGEVYLIQSLHDWSGNDFWQWQEHDKEKLIKAAELLASLPFEPVEQSLVEEPMLIEFKQIGIDLSDLQSRFNKSIYNLDQKINELVQSISELKQQIKNLENKKRPYKSEMTKLKELLEDKLRGQSKVWVLCEEMEIIEESWRNAIEGYLNTQRFDLLVEPHAFTKALSIYEREKWYHGLEGVGLVDTEKEQRYLGVAKKGSLAEILQSDHPVIKARIEHLLGKVMKARDEQDLRNYNIAITSTCMSYHNLVARQIPKKNYEVPYIGAQAIVRQLEIKRNELELANNNFQNLRECKQELENWSTKLSEKKSYYQQMSEQLHLPLELYKKKQYSENILSELANLDTTEIEKLEKEYEFWNEQANELQNKLQDTAGEKAKKELEKINVTNTYREQLDNVQRAEETILVFHRQLSNQLQQRAQDRYKEIALQQTPLEIKIGNMEGSKKGNETKRNNTFEELCNKRRDYNREYTFNGDITAVDNKQYQSMLEDISAVDIPKYQQQLEEAKKQAEEEFKSHFVYRLREAILGARREFYQLNYALKNFPFHKDHYHFEVKPSERYKKFYDAIMDPEVMEKGSLFDLPDNNKKAVLHDLFERLIKGEVGEQLEFTDYRRFLDFDIQVSGDTNYSFSRVLREKSGGETQTPFYIAILASFNHLYSSGKTMRLVVFDEAFNKMDEERIQTSLRLIKNMNLQLIASVPDEKMQHMAPEVSTVLVVNKEGFNCFVDMIGRQEVEEDEQTEEKVSEDYSLFTS